MKYHLLLLLIGIGYCAFGQRITVTHVDDLFDPIGTVYLSGQFVGAENQKIAFGNQNKGGVNKPLKMITTDDQGKFELSYDIPFQDYYYLKFENNQLLNVILTAGDSIKIYGDVKDILNLSNFIGSEPSEAMNQFLAAYTDFKKIEDSLRLVNRKDPMKAQEVNAFFAPLASDFYSKRDKFIRIYSKTGATIVALNAIDQAKEWQLYQNVADNLALNFGGSPTVQNLMSYVDNQRKQKEATAFLNPGGDSKEIALPDTAGNVIRLSDLKGKVVLIDFWASWCRPCRAENPNVVKLYNHYNEHGFEVFSVSLDSNKDMWKNAIKQDGLIWPYHVSDLKKWQNLAARDYGVKSIPFTVLIDQEGKVIATNLRGTALENQLKTIFGH